MRHHTCTALTLSLGLLFAGCSDADGDSPAGARSGEPTPGRSATPADDSALVDMSNPAFPEPLIDPDAVQSGGPPPDGIPPIDDPTFDSASDVDWMGEQEPIMVLTVEGETKGYPLRVMTWHEIVNDTIGGVPVAVTFCPLCNSGVAFQRQVDDEVLTFGTSGRLYQDNLVMYDRQSESLWPQLTGKASIGTRTGAQLTAIPMGTVAWGDFVGEYPQAPVLSQDTGFDRPYGKNPYEGYDDADGDLIFALEEELDDRLLVKERVIGLSGISTHIAFVRSALQGEQPQQVEIDGMPVVLWHSDGQNSALDTSEITDGADIGTVGVFDPRVDGQELTFTRSGDDVQDEQTQSTWSVTGQAIDGELQGQRLQPVTHLDTFWFSWVLFHPDTTVRGS